MSQIMDPGPDGGGADAQAGGDLPERGPDAAAIQGHKAPFDRLDDGARRGYADLKQRGEHVMTAGDVARCYPEQIHSVWNVGDDISMSLHTYGRHINYTGRSEFDPERKLEKPYIVKVAGGETAPA